MTSRSLFDYLFSKAIMNFSERIAVTASLNVSYRAPTKADQFVVIHTKLDELKGRKCFVSATIETLDGVRLVEATYVFWHLRSSYIFIHYLPFLARCSFNQKMLGF